MTNEADTVKVERERNPHPTGSDASVTDEMVEAALGAFLDAKAPDGCTIDDYLWIDPLDAVELGVKLTLDEKTDKPRYHGYSDIAVDEQLWARQQLLRPMIRAALTAALSLPTPKGTNDERLPCDVFVPPALILRKGVKYSTLFEALSHRVGKNIAPIDAAAIRGAS